jgi:DNA-binding transcriptional ArsR family regulator
MGSGGNYFPRWEGPLLVASRLAPFVPLVRWERSSGRVGTLDTLGTVQMRAIVMAGSPCPPLTSPIDMPGSRVYITTCLYKHSVMQISDRLDLTFAALADPTRRAILGRLARGEASVRELAEPFDMSQPAISKHLKVLERAGLVSVDIDAQRRPRRLEPRRLEEAVDWIERYRELFEQSYQRLDALLETLRDKPVSRKRARR